MSGAFRLSPAAVQDIQGIWNYLALEQGNETAANRLFDDLEAACGELARVPSLGHRRPDLTDDPTVLFYCVRKWYLIVYYRETEPLQIARVFHGARDLRSQLQDPD